ncbi:hypothetical protein NIE88_04910 [Sporolactobacillus shoreicorticis]|uniref:HK97 gp10 family phage protein n=1 Tax=Sporolactobacillus shoreicorticis TaxID=1923877 RepID=A0ABW5RZH0_9BACL|nr:hypothetical protein [Sporolactobacillus shoreicorticis]MCO7125114.1 hypothetical protein [Sporolactobacillus shoreicorticis]
MKLELIGADRLAQKLLEKSATDFEAVANKNIRDIYTRGQKQPYQGGVPPETGGTPYASGQLRISLTYRQGEVGYLKSYAPHVEYGHRTVNGGYVPGQYYLKRNVDTQRSIYKEDLKEKLRE